mmetsp:Transcript_127478/g.407996  ORF Transcript_127478/g.407996 Transcript_127478/m.407996 type:complete len:213 (-) Transcript_127478:8-646(-)
MPVQGQGRNSKFHHLRELGSLPLWRTPLAGETQVRCAPWESGSLQGCPKHAPRKFRAGGAGAARLGALDLPSGALHSTNPRACPFHDESHQPLLDEVSGPWRLRDQTGRWPHEFLLCSSLCPSLCPCPCRCLCPCLCPGPCLWRGASSAVARGVGDRMQRCRPKPLASAWMRLRRGRLARRARTRGLRPTSPLFALRCQAHLPHKSRGRLST